MKKLGLLLFICLSFGATANYDSSIEIAKRYCTTNMECIDIISLELDSAYHAGIRDGKKKNANLGNMIVIKKQKLTNFCDKAPNADLCLSYREELLKLYIKGLAEK